MSSMSEHVLVPHPAPPPPPTTEPVIGRTWGKTGAEKCGSCWWSVTMLLEGDHHGHRSVGILFFLCFKLLILYWSIASYRCCDSFRWAAKRLSHTYACIHSPPDSPPIQAATIPGEEFPVLYSRSLWVIHLKYNDIYSL